MHQPWLGSASSQAASLANWTDCGYSRVKLGAWCFLSIRVKEKMLCKGVPLPSSGVLLTTFWHHTRKYQVPGSLRTILQHKSGFPETLNPSTVWIAWDLHAVGVWQSSKLLCKSNNTTYNYIDYSSTRSSSSSSPISFKTSSSSCGCLSCQLDLQISCLVALPSCCCFHYPIQ
jgi:hypothetical protein